MRQLTLFVLDFVSLIDYNVMELDFLQVAQTDSDTLKWGDDDVELACWNALFDDVLSFLFGGDELDDFAARQPFPEFIFPVTKCNFGRYDDVWAFNLFELLDEWNDGDGLDGLSQTHIIC